MKTFINILKFILLLVLLSLTFNICIKIFQLIFNDTISIILTAIVVVFSMFKAGKMLGLNK